jgi:multiple sugar transport system substrate-binding protein
VVGLALGVAATVLVDAYGVPALRSEPRWEPGRLVILSGADDSVGEQRQALIDQWNALDGRPDAEIIQVTGGADAERAEMVEHAQAGGRGVDVYNLDVTLMAEFAEFGYLRPLDERGVDFDGFLAGPLETCRRDGELWALPFNTDAALLYYRTDLVEGGRAPGSWPGLRGSVEAVFAGPPSRRAGLLAGYASQFADYEGLTVNAIEAIWAAGGDVVDGDDVVVDTPEALEGLRRLADGLTRDNPSVILPASRDFDEAATTQAFRDGEVLFMRNWPVAYRELTSTGESRGPVPFRVAPLPGPSVLGGQNLAIAAHTDQPHAAQELIEFLTSARSQQLLFERGGFAATREIVYQDPEVRLRYPYSQTLLAAIRRAQQRPVTPYYAAFSEVFREGVQHALANGGQPPDGFAGRLEDALRGVSRE